MNRLTVARPVRPIAGFLAAGVAAIIVYRLTESVWLETAIVLPLTLAGFVAVAAAARRSARIASPWSCSPRPTRSGSRAGSPGS
ncbi:MAG: hypothetical protein H0V45_10695 [Actinobacteria bacterium]|nr:hypothetical protein [Actinomycetota bacterium]